MEATTIAIRVRGGLMRVNSELGWEQFPNKRPLVDKQFSQKRILNESLHVTFITMKRFGYIISGREAQNCQRALN